MLRQAAAERGHGLAMRAAVGDIIAFYVHSDEAWALGEVLQPQEATRRWGHRKTELVGDSSVVFVVQDDVPESLNWMGELHGPHHLNPKDRSDQVQCDELI